MKQNHDAIVIGAGWMDANPAASIYIMGDVNYVP